MNYNGSDSPFGPVVSIISTPTTYVYIDTLRVINANLKGNSLIANFVSNTDNFQVVNGYYSQVTVPVNKPMFTFENVDNLEFKNHTFIEVIESSSSSETSLILRASSLSEISDIGMKMQRESFR